MNKGINLLPHGNRKILKQRNTLKILRFVAIAFLGILTVSSLSLFLINFGYSSQELKNKEKTLISNYSTLNSKFIKLFLTHDRLSEIQAILSKKKPFESVINTVVNLTPANLDITNLRVDKVRIEITASSKTLSSINTFTDSLVLLSKQKKQFGKITQSGVAFDGKEKYFVSLKIELL